MRGRSPLNHWLEIAVPAHADAVEVVSESLTGSGHKWSAVDMPTVCAGGRGAETGDYTVKAYLLADADAFAKVSDARDALGHLQAFGLGPIGELAVRTIDDEDWLAPWKASLAPIRGGAFLGPPAWSDAGARGAIALSADPRLAVGTGLPPQTPQC